METINNPGKQDLAGLLQSKKQQLTEAEAQGKPKEELCVLYKELKEIQLQITLERINKHPHESTD